MTTTTASQADAERHDRSPLVLIAEDDLTAAEMLEVLLTRVGYRVRIARDGASALRMSEETPGPDAVLLDWMLPGMTGLEVCRRIRERRDPLTLPILMVTAKADPESISAAFEAGASDYITKPFLGAELRARINAHLRIKELSNDRRELDERLMEQDKLSTLGLLVSGVAHDLNNPLGGIYGYAQLLLEREMDPERLVAIERILSEVQRCNRIVADLLSFAGRHAPTRQRVKVAEVLAETFELRDRHLVAKGLTWTLRAASDIPEVVADPYQLKRVFLNIIVNAEHALRERGTLLRVDAERVQRFGATEWLAVRFFNDGPPIPPETMLRIFEPFFTTKGTDEGTGLGLPICRRIVREHGGEIEVESEPEGTTFTILLPAAVAGAAPATGRDEALLAG